MLNNFKLFLERYKPQIEWKNLGSRMKDPNPAHSSHLTDSDRHPMDTACFPPSKPLPGSFCSTVPVPSLLLSTSTSAIDLNNYIQKRNMESYYQTNSVTVTLEPKIGKAIP